MPNDQRVKTVILTGASRGIGHATVVRFAREGWRVISCSRDALPPACPVSAENSSPQGKIRHFCVDLENPQEVDHFIAQATNYLGDDPVHALVNNAAQSPKLSYKERLGCLNGSLESWRQVFELNFFTPLRLARGFAPLLARSKQDTDSKSENPVNGGSIVNVTSIAGHYIHPFAGSAYSTSKAALSALTREMAGEFAELGVRVNAVAPGEIETAMIGPEYEPLTTRIPLQRLGTPEEVAGTIFRLCGPDFSYVTGTEIFLTGGQHMQ